MHFFIKLIKCLKFIELFLLYIFVYFYNYLFIFKEISILLLVKIVKLLCKSNHTGIFLFLSDI